MRQHGRNNRAKVNMNRIPDQASGAAVPPPSRAAVATGAYFRGLDQFRCWSAELWDRVGLAPQQTPSQVLHQEPGMCLRHYASGSSTGPVLLIVPAPIKRHWIWDLHPSCSVVQAALARKCAVYLVEWGHVPSDWGLDAYVDAMGRCIDRVESETGRTPHLLAHSLGGTLSALHAARHPTRLASLVLVEAPLRFGEATGAFAPLLARSPPAAEVLNSLDSVPGSMLGMAAGMASPGEFVWQRRLDAMSAAMQGPEAMRRHMLAMRWTLGELPLPAPLVAQVMDALYREDGFMRGTLRIGGEQVAPHHVQAPLVAVVDPHSRVVPAESVTGLLDAASSTQKLVLHYDGDVGVGLRHLGALIGESAHRDIWPRIFNWLEALFPHP
jgi:polyhydroxyalkanoate synthase